jgi:hypothetical protein
MVLCFYLLILNILCSCGRFVPVPDETDIECCLCFNQQNYGLISSATVGKYLMQLFEADAAPNSSELATMTKDHEICAESHESGQPSANRVAIRAHTAQGLSRADHNGLPRSNPLVFKAEQWGGWGRSMSVNAEAIIGDRVPMARRSQLGGRGGTRSNASSDPTTYSFLLRRPILR